MDSKNERALSLVDSGPEELTPEELADLKQRHGDNLISAHTPNKILMVFKAPSKEIWAYYQDGLSREKVTRTQCFLRLALDCVVRPSQQDAATIFTKYPGMPTALANDIGEMAGLSDELNIKKL